MSVVKRIRRALVAATAAAVAGAMLAVVPAGPANAAPPSVVGEYASLTPTVSQTIRSQECVDAASVKMGMDLTGVGAALESQGWTTDRDVPARAVLYWKYTVEVVGPDNYYAKDYDSFGYPTAEHSDTFRFCPDDFGTSKVSPGVYTATATYSVYNYRYGSGRLCHANEPCDGFDNIYTKTLTTTFTLDFSQTCKDARAKAPTLRKAVKTAKRALVKAKKTRNKAKIRKAKKRLKRAKAKRAKNTAIIGTSC